MPQKLSIVGVEPLDAAKPSLSIQSIESLGEPIVPGNIDLAAQPRVTNKDGSVSTVRSISVGVDGKEVLIPTVAADGSGVLSDDAAVAQFERTGKHLGIFATPDDATAYAKQLHEDYATGKYEKGARPAAGSTTAKRPASVHGEGFVVPGSVRVTNPPADIELPRDTETPTVTPPAPAAATATPTRMSDAGLDVLKQREGGFYGEPYQDHGGLAIGYGTQTWKGNKVTPELRVTQDDADAELRRMVDDVYAPIVNAALKVPVSQAQYDALVSLAYNDPPAAVHLAERLNKGETLTAKQFLASATVEGKPNAGLRARRGEEFAQFTAPPAAPAPTIASATPPPQPSPIRAGEAGSVVPGSVHVTEPAGPPVRLGSAKTGGTATQPPFGKSPIDIPAEGAIQMARGAAAMPHALSGPTVQTGRLASAKTGGRATEPADPDALMNAASDILEGAMKVGSPLVLAGALVDLPATVLGIATATVASTAAGKAAEAAGASPAAQRFARALAAASTAVVGSQEVIESAKTGTASMARALVLAGQLSGRGVGRAYSPTARAATVSEAMAVTRPTAHAPVAAIEEAGVPSMPQSDVGETAAQVVQGALDRQPPDYFKQNEGRAPTAAPLSVASVEPLVDESGRPLGGYAGPERRLEQTGPPPGVEDRRLPAAEQVFADARNNPALVRQADEMRKKADAARAAAEPLSIASVEPLEGNDAVTEGEEPSGSVVEHQGADGNREVPPAAGGGDRVVAGPPAPAQKPLTPDELSAMVDADASGDIFYYLKSARDGYFEDGGAALDNLATAHQRRSIEPDATATAAFVKLVPRLPNETLLGLADAFEELPEGTQLDDIHATLQDGVHRELLRRSGQGDLFAAPSAVTPKKPVTPQLPPAGGPGYVVPTFVTAPHAAATAETNPESRYAGEDAAALNQATEQEQRERFQAITALNERLHQLLLEKATETTKNKVKAELTTLRDAYEGAYSELSDAVSYQESARLRARVEGRKVGTDEGPAVPSDRAPLAGAPPAHGEAPRGEGAPAARGGVRSEADRGGGEQPDSTGAPGDAGAGTNAPGVGVPPERGGRAGTPERRAGELAAHAADFVISPDVVDIATGGERTRVASNLDAIATLKRIDGDNRPATADEQQVLSKYVGWGGLANAFKENHPDYATLKAALTDEEYRSARASTPNAHYTSPTVIRAVYDALARFGVKGPLRFLEPAAGVGHFLGLMPADLAATAARSAVELDSISGRITKALYPSARVQVTGFERAKLANDHFDVIVSNVPFGNYQVSDVAFKGRPKSLTSSIHNYYFAKALDLVRPGGIVAFITSRYTMDAQDSTVRKYLASRANLLGVIRLPNTAFKANAGTEVVADIIFLQRTDTPTNAETWVPTSSIFLGPDKVSVTVNHQIATFPELVLGHQELSRGMHSDHEYTVEPTGDLSKQLKAVFALLPENVYEPPTTRAATPTLHEQLPASSSPQNVREGSWFERDGKLYVNERGSAIEQKLAPPEAARVRGLMKVRDAVRETMRTMLDTTSTDADVKRAQRTLNTDYDRFVQKHGYLAKPKNYRSLREDPDVFTLLALEEWAPKAEKPEKAAIFTKRTLKPNTPVDHVDTPKEALLVTLNESGRVDWARMASLTGQTEHELQLGLEGLVFQDPETGAWEQADRYLSGNVKAKLKAAQRAGERYVLNVQALEAVQPVDLEPADIAVRLGAPWVPQDVISTFAQHLGLHGLRFRYTPSIAKWTVDDRRFYGRHSVQATEQWGTQRVPADDLLTAALNLGDPIVRDTVRDAEGNEKSVVNQSETVAAREKLQAMQDEFKSWLWEDAERATALARIYNDTMNTMREWVPDGSHLTLPGMSAGVTLRPHQKNFIWRGLQSTTALAHHVVGAGKTFAGIALAMEKRRLGLARKPVVVVPNHLPQQWARDVLKLYPAARVLASEKDDFKPKNRKRFLNRIATGDWDVVILPYTHFGRIRVSDETFNAYLQQELDNLEIEIERARDEGGKKDPTVKELEKAKMNLQAKLRTKKDEQVKDTTPTFEELGIDMLVVDEAHNYKKLWFPTKMTRVAGVPTQGSQRAFDLFVKSRSIAQKKATGGSVFLTGTPISNTMAEMFVLMRYLMQGTLDARGIPQFDGWAATFGEKVSAFEISPTGRGFRQKTRFARFTNLPELMQMYRSFADVQTADMLKLPTPPLKDGKAQLHVVPATAELDAFVGELLERYEAVLGKHKTRPKPDPSEDNPLLITTDGRKAALDLRLVGEHQPEGGKVDESGQTIYDIWKRETHRKGTQLVFSDLGTPSKKAKVQTFNVYQALAEKLVDLGIPRAQIAFIHDAKTDAQKQQLFDNVRAGNVRILMGSTEKMGAGTNVQDRLVALHHLDAPWRPSDIEQREGRILRQGNLFGDKELGSKEYDPNFAVEIHTYLSERSFDAYLWQLLESKARFIQQAIKGDSTSREIDDADDVVMSFGAAKAIATGNPAIMEHAKAQSDVARLEVSEANYGKRKWRLQNQLAALPEQIEGWEHREADARALVAAIKLPAERKDLMLTVDGKVLAGEDAAKAVAAAFEKARKAGFRTIDAYHGITNEVVVGQAAGVDVRGFITSNSVMNDVNFTTHWVIAKGDASMSKAATIGTGAMASLWHFLENGPKEQVARAETELQTLRGSLATAKAEVNKPYPHAAQIKGLREKIKTLEQALNLDAKSQQEEAAAAGSIVTTAEEDRADAAAERAETAAEEGDGEDGVDEAGETAEVDDEEARRQKTLAELRALRAPGQPTLRENLKKLDAMGRAAEAKKKGTTLQSTILPGAAEFGEHVLEPALKAAADAIRANRSDFIGLFAPDTTSPHAVRTAGILRANLAARAQRTQRAQRNLRKIEKAMDSWSHEDSLHFWDVMEGDASPDTLDDDTRAIAELYRDILDKKREQLLARDLIKNYLEYYWGHEWQRASTTIEAALRRLFGKRPLQGPESFRKRRSIPTTRDGIERAGLEPVSWNPTTQLLRKLLEMDKSIAAYDIRRELKQRGEAKFVAAGKKGPDGWVRYPESFGTVYGPQTFKTATGEEARVPFGRLVAGHYYGPAESVRLLTNHLSPGLRGKSTIFDGYRHIGNFLNQLQLSFSFFHMMMTGMESVVSKQALVFEQIARGQFSAAAKTQAKVLPVVGFVTAPILDVIRGHKAMKAFYAHDANAAVLDDLIGQIVNAGGGVGWDLFEHAGAPEAFMAALRGKHVGAAALRAIPALIELQAKPIMQGWVPRLKLAAFLDLAAMEMETLGPEPDLEEARRVLGAAWDSIDNRFGELRYDNLFWHNALKDLGMASVRALGWNIGTVREMFGAPAAQLRQLGVGGGGGFGKPPIRMVNVGKKRGEPIYAPQSESRLHRKTAWFAAMVLMYGLAGALYMYVRTGKRPSELKDYFFPQNGETDRNGRPVRVSIAGYFKDLYAVTHNLPGSAFETAAHKIHPLLTLLYDVLVKNEDFYGTEIRNADDPLVEQLRDVFGYVIREYTPISVQQAQAQKGAPIAKQAESFLGITKAPASVTRSALETYLHDIAPPTHRTKEQAEQAAERRGIREAVRTPPGQPRPTVDTSHLSPRSKQQTAKTAGRSPLAAQIGSSDVSMRQALKAYELATPDERVLIRAALSKKLPSALASTPPADRKALMDAYRKAIVLPVAQRAAS